MAPDGERASRKTSKPSSSSAIYSLSTTKAVKPANEAVVPKQSQQIYQRRQRQQHQLQQIRSIRRKRTVAFAVNHERGVVSEPHTACVVSVEKPAAAQQSCDSSSARSECHSTANRDSIPRASLESECTFQPAHGTLIHGTSTTDVPTSQRFDTNNNIQNISIDIESITRNMPPKQSNNENNRLSVDIRSAEGAGEFLKNMAPTTTSSYPAPVPVSPTSVLPMINDSSKKAASTTTKRQRIGRPPRNIQSSSNQEEQSSSSPVAKPPLKRKIKRVRYDMECVPCVEINEDIWESVSFLFRKQSQSIRSLSRQVQRDEIIDNDSIYSDRKARSVSHSPTAFMIPSNDRSNNGINESQYPASLLLHRSVLWVPSSRQEWEDCVSELKAVCTSAAFRRWSKGIMNEYNNNIVNNNSTKISDPTKDLNNLFNSDGMPTPFRPPLSQAFIKDRVRIDDPLRGYQIRHSKGGWLQGFLVWTNFTVWTQDFRWDSNHPSSGLLHQDVKSGYASINDDDGTLSKELQALPRGAQDPLDGGIVLEQVAEISLLGGLGCGKVLLWKAIEDIRTSWSNGKRDYKYVVLQATEGSRSFYEQMGFVRVGAVCRYRWAEHCTNKLGVATANNGENPDLNRVLATSVGPPPTFHGYRHWTYTNESSKSLDAHGGPSIMMCLKLDDGGYVGKKEHKHQQTVSELLKPLIVLDKPVIQVLGNVANPDAGNTTPTRKSQRRRMSGGRLGSSHLEFEGEKKCKRARRGPPIVEVAESGELTKATSMTRRTSSRSNRGSNLTLSNSDFVLYGIERGQNCSNESIANATSRSRSCQRRQQQGTNLAHKVPMETAGKEKEKANGSIAIPSAAGHCDLVNASSHTRVPSISRYEEQTCTKISHVSSLSTSTTKNSISSLKSVSKSSSKKSHTAVSLPQLEMVCNLDKDISVCTRNRTQNSSKTAIPDRECKSPVKSMGEISTPVDRTFTQVHDNQNANIKCTGKIESDSSRIVMITTKPVLERCNSTTTGQESPSPDILVGMDENSLETLTSYQGIPETKRQQRGIYTVASPTRGATFTVRCRIKQVGNSGFNDTAIDPLASKESEMTKVHNEHCPIEVETNKPPSPASARQKALELPQQRTSICPDGTCTSNHLIEKIPSKMRRNRSRQPAISINKSELLKQKVYNKAGIIADFYNQIVIRRNIQSVLDRGRCVSKKRKRGDDENSKNGRRRWRYNGGLMVDHRYEFCYYFVLHYNEPKKSLTIVPLIKDGVFERATRSKTNGIRGAALDEKMLGRPRFQCNILATDKNWIRNAPVEDYVVVPKAVAVVGTSLVAEEAWDIVSDDSATFVEDEERKGVGRVV